MIQRILSNDEFKAIFDRNSNKHMIYVENGRYGVLDKFGNKVLPAKFEYIKLLKNGLIIASEDDKGYKIYSKSGILLSTRVFDLEDDAKVYASYF